MKLEMNKNFEQEMSAEINGDHGVQLSALITDDFIHRHTSFSSFDSFLDAGGFHCETLDDFIAVPEDKLDSYIAETTKFSSWQNLLNVATAEYVKRQYGN